MFYGGSYGSAAYGGRITYVVAPSQTTIVSGKPGVMLSTKPQTAVLTSAERPVVLTSEQKANTVLL